VSYVVEIRRLELLALKGRTRRDWASNFIAFAKLSRAPCSTMRRFAIFNCAPLGVRFGKDHY
jgi:hypothetical protein